jgi:hypothetical protein
MIGLVWNYRGLGNVSKSEFLKELIKDEKVDFIGLQETNRKTFSDTWLNSIGGNKIFVSFSSPPDVRSGGLLVGFNSEIFDVRGQEYGEFMIRTLILHREKNSFGNLLMCMEPLKMTTKTCSLVNFLPSALEVSSPCW